MRSRGTLALLIAAVAIMAVGTVLWITGILRPVPTIVPGVIRSAARARGTIDLTVDVGDAAPIDRAGETVRRVARSIASGTLATPPLVTFDVRDGPAPLMRLAYDRGILSAGAVAGGTADHLLGLAGEGSVWPPRPDPRLIAYCGRMETMTGAFCKRATGG